MSELQVARAACDAQYPSRVGVYVAHAKCVNDAIDRFAISRSPYPDLVRLQQAMRLSLSARVDRGEMSPEDAQLAMARSDAEITNTAMSRNATKDAATTNAIADVFLIDRLQRR
jgi:hypothetical protein